MCESNSTPKSSRSPILSTSSKQKPTTTPLIIINKRFIICGSALALLLVVSFQVILASTFIVYEGGNVFDRSSCSNLRGDEADAEKRRKLENPITETPKAAPIPSFELDGELLFNPEEFRTGNKSKYINKPIPCSDCDQRAQAAMAKKVETPTGLIHKPESTIGNDVVIAIMPISYMITRDQTKFISSLRQTGYDGHIILGVQPNIPDTNLNYLKSHFVTIYTVTLGPCNVPTRMFTTSEGKSPECFQGLETLPYEWGKYELARQWLYACAECSGRVLLALNGITTFFQTNPFDHQRKEDLLFAEELAAHTNPFYYDPHKLDVRHGIFGASDSYASTFRKCYPKFKVRTAVGENRPLLLPTSVLGSKNGIDQYLSILMQELGSKIEDKMCHYPISENVVMNYLYYTGAFGGSSIATMPWGTGSIQDMGRPCLNQYLEYGDGKSQLDIVKLDLNITGFIANRYETNTDGIYLPAPMIHNYYNCDKWGKAYLKLHGELTDKPLYKSDGYLETLELAITELNPMKTSYERSTVVQQAPWFPAEKRCKATCCAQAIAIALDADREHLITSVDGLDLGDVAVFGHNRNDFLQWAISDLNYDILPCLQKGTIVFADHEGGGVKRFFDIYRPKMNETFLLITGRSDGVEPLHESDQGKKILQTDKLLMGWYGINPCYNCGADHPKFHMMHLGLSASLHHQKFLAARLNQRGFDNPFSAEKKKRWTESAELAAAKDATRLLFVKFRINRHSQHR